MPYEFVSMRNKSHMLLSSPKLRYHTKRTASLGSQPQPEIAAAGGSSGVADVPNKH